MKFDPIMLIIIGVFFYPIVKGIVFGFSSYGIKRDLEGITDSIAFVIAILIGVKYFRNIFLQYGQTTIIGVSNYLPNNISSVLENNPVIIYIILVPLLIYIVFKLISGIFNFICSITIYGVVDAVDEVLRDKSFFIRAVIGAVVQIPKAICYLLVTLLIFNLVSMLNINKDFNNYLSKSETYNYLGKTIVAPFTNSTVAKQLPKIIDNSFRIVIKQNNLKNTIDINNIPVGKASDNAVVYYNGVTLEEGIKSNSEIDSFARNYTASETDTISKARKLYTWEGQNIDYDYQKANMVLNNDYNVSSGAIPAYNTRKGICFDYACLYVAMCRADNIKVRLVTGEGFNGVSWVSHAWNMVYIPNENTWINVDTTFSKGGNYFNSRLFNLDHRNAKVVGEW